MGTGAGLGGEAPSDRWFIIICFYWGILHADALSADLPGQRDNGRSEAAAGYDWLLLGNGRGYSWRELSLDHAS